MQTADVVIIGGGIVGASIAWHLTEAGCRNVLIVERESHQGKGSTGKSMGGVRAQFATKPNIQMSLYSIPFYAAFEERLGHPSRISRSGIHVRRHQAVASGISEDQSGAAKVARAEESSHDHARGDCRDRAAVALRRRAGRQLLPDRRLRRSLQRDGRLYHRSCEQGASAMALDRGHGDSRRSRISGVETARGPVSTRDRRQRRRSVGSRSRGAGGNRPASRADAPHADPDRAVRRRIARDAHGDRHDQRISLPAGEPGVSPGVERSRGNDGLQDEFRSDVHREDAERAADRVPCFENLAVNPKRAWAGLYEMSPDHHASSGRLRNSRASSAPTDSAATA